MLDRYVPEEVVAFINYRPTTMQINDLTELIRGTLRDVFDLYPTEDEIKEYIIGILYGKKADVINFIETYTQSYIAESERGKYEVGHLRIEMKFDT